MASVDTTKISEKLRRKKSSILLIYRRGSTISVRTENFVKSNLQRLKEKKMVEKWQEVFLWLP